MIVRTEDVKMDYARFVWTQIVRQKILNQAVMLRKYGY